MGGNLEPPKRKTYSQTFDEVFPYYLSLGMTYDLFWNDRPELVKMYRKADELNNKRKNQELWLQGIYMRYALASTVGNMFVKHKSEMTHYPKEPIPITLAEMKLKKEQLERERFERIKAGMVRASQKVKRTGDDADVNNDRSVTD